LEEYGRALQCRRLVVEAPGPAFGQSNFESAEREITRDERQVACDFENLVISPLAGSMDEGFDEIVNRCGIIPGCPNPFELFLGKKCGRQAALRIEVQRDRADSQFLEHPGQVVDERRLPDAALIAEKSDGLQGRSAGTAELLIVPR